MSPPGEEHSGARTTRVSRLVEAGRGEIYRALVDPGLVAQWLAPGTMTCRVHEFEPIAGGRFRMSLKYENPEDGPGGKTTEDTDTFHGHFAEVVPGERIVQIVEFESDLPGIAGPMRVSWILADAESAVEVTAVCEDIPQGIRLEDNEAGSASSLAKLARLVEAASGVVLRRKLGLRPGMRVRLLNAPEHYWDLLGGSPEAAGVDALPTEDEDAAFTHVFATDARALRESVTRAREGMAVDGMVWVSWPKKSSGIPSEIGRSEVMAAGKAVGLVDTKVCAVDEVWSGLKFVIPVRGRGGRSET